MTKEEIAKKYEIDENGVIKSPGKFEGEMYYAVHYWNMTLDGCDDRDEMLEDGTLISIYDIGQIDYDDFPELQGNTELRIWEDDNGFVYCQVN